MAASQRPQSRCALLPPSVPHVIRVSALNPDEKNSAVHVYVMIGPTSIRTKALQRLCHQVLQILLEKIFQSCTLIG
jgi:hypothetical protein